MIFTHKSNKRIGKHRTSECIHHSTVPVQQRWSSGDIHSLHLQHSTQCPSPTQPVPAVGEDKLVDLIFQCIDRKSTGEISFHQISRHLSSVLKDVMDPFLVEYWCFRFALWHFKSPSFVFTKTSFAVHMLQIIDKLFLLAGAEDILQFDELYALIRSFIGRTRSIVLRRSIRLIFQRFAMNDSNRLGKSQVLTGFYRICCIEGEIDRLLNSLTLLRLFT